MLLRKASYEGGGIMWRYTTLNIELQDTVRQLQLTSFCLCMLVISSFIHYRDTGLFRVFLAYSALSIARGENGSPRDKFPQGEVQSRCAVLVAYATRENFSRLLRSPRDSALYGDTYRARRKCGPLPSIIRGLQNNSNSQEPSHLERTRRVSPHYAEDDPEPRGFSLYLALAPVPDSTSPALFGRVLRAILFRDVS
jgi:hypothetical protein